MKFKKKKEKAANQETPSWCLRHWQPYQSGEVNGILASILTMQAVLEDERFMRACGWNPETGQEADGSPARLNAEMEKIKPICCWLGDEAMELIYQTAKHQTEKAKGKQQPPVS